MDSASTLAFLEPLKSIRIIFLKTRIRSGHAHISYLSMVSYCFDIKCKLLQMAHEALLDQICLSSPLSKPLLVCVLTRSGQLKYNQCSSLPQPKNLVSSLIFSPLPDNIFSHALPVTTICNSAFISLVLVISTSEGRWESCYITTWARSQSTYMLLQSSPKPYEVKTNTIPTLQIKESEAKRG